MQASAFFASAERILAQGEAVPDECSCRAAAHALYYAVAHFVAPLLDLQLASDTAGIKRATDQEKYDGARHRDVARKLQAYAGNVGYIYDVRRVFRGFLLSREKADYNLSAKMNLIEIQKHMEQVRNIFKAAGINPVVE